MKTSPQLPRLNAFLKRCVAALLPAFPLAAFAAPPANDDFADRETVAGALPLSFSSDTTEATLEETDPQSYLSRPFTVWFEWTPAADGLYKIQVDRALGNDSNRSFSLGVAEGNQASLIANSIFYSNDSLSPVYFRATGGTPYQFLLGSGEGGAFDLELAPTLSSTPGLVDLGDVAPVDVERGSGLATDMQWMWTAPETGLYALDFYDGAWALRQQPEFNVAPLIGGFPPPLFPEYFSEHDWGNGFHYFYADAGRQYLIETFTPEVSFTLKRLPDVPNGVLSGAVDLGATDAFTVRAHLVQGLSEPFEQQILPFSWSLGSHWWKWRAPSPGLYRITYGASRLTQEDDFWYPPQVHVYKGDTPETITPAPSSPGWWEIDLYQTRERTGTFVISATEAGEEFVIGLFNIIEGTGPYRPGQWEVSLESLPDLPNDDFADALTLVEDLDPIPFVGHYATLEDGEPAPTSPPPEDFDWQRVGHPDVGSLWWKWTAPDDTPIEFRADSDFYWEKAVFDIYTGNSLNDLQLVSTFSEAEDAEDKAILPVAGQTYYLQLGGVLITGTVAAVSRPDLASPPDNDHFANAATIDLGGESLIGIDASCATATVEPGEPMPASRTRWWRWTADRDAWVTFEYRRGSVAVYTGDTLEALERLSGWGTANIKHSISALRFPSVTGTTYHISIGDDLASLDPGQLSLRATPMIRPPNDTVANRIDIEPPIRHPGFQSIHNDYEFHATIDDPNEPVPTLPGTRQTTWLSWTPEFDSTATLLLSAHSNGADSIPFGLDVYTLAAGGTLVPFDTYTRDPPDGWPFWIIEGLAGVEYVIGVSSTREGSKSSLQFHATSQFLVEREEWFGQFPTLTNAQMDDDADPAGDGIPNIVKRALGLSPVVHAYSGHEPNVGNLPTIEHLTDGTVRLVYTVDPEYVDHLRIYAETSTNGISWGGGASPPVSLGDNRYAIELPVEGESMLMARLRIWPDP